MQQTLVAFVKALRTAEVQVSPAETLDALATLELVGYRDRQRLKDSLALALSKSPEEKQAFDQCFERFFTFERFPRLLGAEAAPPAEGDGDATPGMDGAGGTGAGSGSGTGGGGAGEAEAEAAAGMAEEAEADFQPLSPTSPLGRLLLSGDHAEVLLRMAEAGREAEVQQIVVFTQKGLYTRKIMDIMGLPALQEEIAALQEEGGRPQNHLASRLKQARERLREEVRDHVERQFHLHADETGREVREELLMKVRLSGLEKRNFKEVQEIVMKMARKLIAIHSKRRKTRKRGQLDVRRTLRSNMQYDGLLFNLKWKAQKVDRPKVMCICDVSGSVSAYARFLLMFLYSLAEILPKVRSFAFSSDLGEVTSLFQENSLEDAMAKTLRDYGNGSTDYGQMLADFKSHCLPDLDGKTTIIILGDARNNYGEPRADILREIRDKAQRLIWLNPEPKSSWTLGDAEMQRYAPACTQAQVCNSLAQLERVVSNLLRHTPA